MALRAIARRMFAAAAHNRAGGRRQTARARPKRRGCCRTIGADEATKWRGCRGKNGAFVFDAELMHCSEG